MKNKCIFCDIAEKRAEAAIIIEDKNTLAFVDIRQTKIGHVLVMPKTHVERIYLIPEELMHDIMKTLVLMSKVIHECIKPDGLNIWQSNGEAGGQEIDHVHFHIFPRYYGDKHFRIYPEVPKIFTIDQRRELADKLKGTLKQISKKTSA